MLWQKKNKMLKKSAIFLLHILFCCANMAKHEDCRQRVCFSCFHKVTLEENLKSASPLVQERIRRLLPSVDQSDSRVPLGFCCSCRAKLKKFEDGKKAFELTKLNDYLATQDRSSPRTECKDCSVCTIASATGLQSKTTEKLGWSIKRNANKDCGHAGLKYLELKHSL